MLALTQKERKKSQLVIAAFVGMTAYLIFSSSTGTGLLSCPIRGLTGLYCFGCGMTRSLAAFIQLDIVESFRMHLLGPIFFVGFVATTLTHSIELVLNRRLEGVVSWVREHQTWFWMMFGASLISFGIWRLIFHPHGY